MEIGIGITTYGGAHLVNHLLYSIKKNTNKTIEYSIVLVDDFSPHANQREESKRVANHYGIHFIQHAENKGVAAAWNSAANFLDTEYVVLLNDDIWVTDGWLDALLYFSKHNHVFGPCLPMWHMSEDDYLELRKDNHCRPRDPETLAYYSNEKIESLRMKDPVICMCPAGCCFMFKKSLYSEIGGFDENLKSFYEETMMGSQAARLGYPSYTLPWPRIYHIWSATFRNYSFMAQQRMQDSAQYYERYWGKSPQDVHLELMPKIPAYKLRWLLDWEEKETETGVDIFDKEVMRNAKI